MFLKRLFGFLLIFAAAAAWIFSIFLGWLLIAQLGLFTQGLEMLRERSEPVNKY